MATDAGKTQITVVINIVGVFSHIHVISPPASPLGYVTLKTNCERWPGILTVEPFNSGGFTVAEANSLVPRW